MAQLCSRGNWALLDCTCEEVCDALEPVRKVDAPNGRRVGGSGGADGSQGDTPRQRLGEVSVEPVQVPSEKLILCEPPEKGWRYDR